MTVILAAIALQQILSNQNDNNINNLIKTGDYLRYEACGNKAISR